jgi:tetratricopeptide (TPR) repeat protein
MKSGSPRLMICYRASHPLLASREEEPFLPICLVTVQSVGGFGMGIRMGIFDDVVAGIILLLFGGGATLLLNGWWRCQVLIGLYRGCAQRVSYDTGVHPSPVLDTLGQRHFQRMICSGRHDELEQRTEFKRLLDQYGIDAGARDRFLNAFYDALIDSMSSNPLWRNRAEEWIKARKEGGQLPSPQPAPELQPPEPTPVAHVTEPPPLPEGMMPLSLLSDRAPNLGDFFDREEECARFKAAWNAEAKHCALFHIGGAGGIGKTTLAARLVRDLGQGHRLVWCDCDGFKPENIWVPFLTELAYLTKDPNARERLRQQRADDQGLLQLAGRVLDEMSTLLVLDNFQEVCDEQRRCPLDPMLRWLDQFGTQARVFLVSRNRPAVLEDAKLPTGADEAMDLEGIPVSFAQRFLKALHLEVDEPTAQRIWEHCGRGIPIAMVHFADFVAQDGLESALELPPYSLETAGTWWESVLRELPPEQRTLLEMASVFEGSVPARLVERIWNVPPTPGNTPARALRVALQQRYLFDFDPQTGTLTVHPLLRRYCYDSLAPEVRREYHCRADGAYRAEARTITEGQPAPERTAWPMEVQRRWIALLDAAMSHCLKARAWQMAIETAYDVNEALALWGEWARSRQVCDEALEAARHENNPREVAAWLHNLAMRLQAQGDYATARQQYEESLQIEQQLGNQGGIASTLHQLGLLAELQGDYATARQQYEESLHIKRQLDNQQGIALTLGQLGSLAHLQGDYPAARQQYEESLRISQQMGDVSSVAIALHQLGLLAELQGDYATAGQEYEESLRIARQLGDQGGIASSLHQLGNLAYLQSDYATARQQYEESLRINRQLGNQEGIANTLHQLGLLAELQGDYATAGQEYEESLRIEWQLGNLEGIALTQWVLGDLEQLESNPTKAVELLREALAIFEQLGSPKAEFVRDDLAKLQPTPGTAEEE